MLRPESHEIETLAKRYFESTLPPNIVLRPQPSDDYGIDAEIEQFLDGKSLGKIFKIQLKGKKAIKFSQKGQRIPYSFPVRKAEYLIEQIEIPAFFVLVDVTSKVVYWCDIHSNAELKQSYNKAKQEGKDSFTFDFLTRNALPNTLSDLLKSVSKAADYIALERVSNIQNNTYASYLSNLNTFDKEEKGLNDKLEILTLKK